MKMVIGNIVALNAGDAAILVGTVRILRRTFGSGLEITVFDADAEASARYYPGFHFRPALFGQLRRWAGDGWRLHAAAGLVLLAALGWRWRFARPLRALLPQALRQDVGRYADAAAVVASGGTYLMPNYDVRGKLFDLLLALALGRPLVLFTQSIGSFRHRRIRLLLAPVLRRARLVLVRDRASRLGLAELGVPADRVAVCADAAFSLADGSSRRDGRRAATARFKVAVSVRQWPHFPDGPEAGMKRYLGAVAHVVQHLLQEDDCEVTFLSTCQGRPEYWVDDAATADRVVARLPAALRARVTVDRRAREPLELLERLRGFDMVLATRLHFAILALCAGVPALAIAYEFKTRELFAELGLAEFAHDIEGLDGDAVLQSLRRLREEWPARAERVWHVVDRSALSAQGAGRLAAAALSRTA